nr:hypothetical protein [Tanacetum cinerariifolium]
FLKTGRALIDVHKGELTLHIENEAVTYNLDQTVRYSANYNQMTTNKINVICEEYSQEVLGFSNVTASGNPTPYDDSIVSTTSPTLTPFGDSDFLLFEEASAFLGDEEKSALIKVLKSHKRAIAWKLSDIQGINLEFCTHKILMEEDYKPAVQHQRRVNPKIHDVIKKDFEKLLDAGLIYPISDSPWVSPLNEATRTDHFPLPFMDQMLKRLAGNEFYCFLDGFSGYFQIPIDPRDQEKTTFTCPYGTFAYPRMPFGLCNAPGTFQRLSLRRVVPKNFDPKGERFLIALRFPTPPLAYAFFSPGATVNDFHPQQYLCCVNCGGPHETFHCQPPQYIIDYPIFNAHNDLLNSQNELSIAQNKLMEQMTQLTSMCELACQIIQKKQEENRIKEEQAANARYWKILACCDDDDDYNSAITPVLSTNEPDNSLSMGDEHLDTISTTESDEVIRSSVEDLVPILSEFEGISDTMCDVHLVNNPTPLEAKDHFEIVINSNDDISSSDNDSLYNENIEYVEALPHDSELFSLEVVEIVIPKDEEIKDNNLREIFLNVHLLIANIEALKDNPTPSSKFLTKSSSTSLKSFLEETNTFHNSLPELENFCFDLEEISSGSTTTHSDISLLNYEALYFMTIILKRLVVFPPTDRSDFTHEEFADELAHILSPPEYDCFYFRNLPDPGELIFILNSGIRENLSTTRVNLPVEDDHSPLLGSQPMLKSSYKAEDGVIISIPPLVGGVADVVVEIKGTGWSISITFRFSLGFQTPDDLSRSRLGFIEKMGVHG